MHGAARGTHCGLSTPDSKHATGSVLSPQWRLDRVQLATSPIAVTLQAVRSLVPRITSVNKGLANLQAFCASNAFNFLRSHSQWSGLHHGNLVWLLALNWKLRLRTNKK